MQQNHKKNMSQKYIEHLMSEGYINTQLMKQLQWEAI